MSGASTWVVNLARAFKDTENEVTILSTGAKPKIYIDDDLPLIYLGRPRSNIKVKLFRLLLINKTFPTFYKKIEARVANDRVKKAFIEIEKSGKVDFLVKNFTDKLPDSLKNIKQISVIHSMISESLSAPSIRQRQLDCPDKLATVSLASKKDAEKSGLKITDVLRNPISKKEIIKKKQ